MSISGELLYLLGYKLEKVEVPRKLYRYKVSETELPLLRANLFRENISHAIRRDPLMEGVIEVYTVCKLSDKQYKTGEIQQSSFNTTEWKLIVRQLVDTSFRIHLRKQGWRRASGGKIYYSREPVKYSNIPSDIPVNIYKALRIRTDHVRDQPVLFADIARRLEFNTDYATIERSYQEKAREIDWVKLYGSTWSFIKSSEEEFSRITHKIELSELDKHVQDSLNAIRYLSDELLQVEQHKYNLEELVALRPYSNRLYNYLRERKVLLSDGIVVLPKHILVPVASFDNIALWGTIPRLTITPSHRVKELEENVKSFGLKRVEFSNIGVSIELDTSELLEVVPSKIREFWVKYGDTQPRDLNEFYSIAFRWEYDEKLFGGPNGWQFTLFTYKSSECSENRDCTRTFDLVIDKTEKMLAPLLGGRERIERYNLDDLEEKTLSEVLKAIAKKQKNRHHAVILIAAPEPAMENKARVIFSYFAAANSLLPHYIDVAKIVREYQRVREKIKSLESYVENAVKYRLRSVLRSLVVRAQQSPMRVRYDSVFEDYVIAGIDATRLKLRARTLSIGVVLVIVAGDGSVEYGLQEFTIETSDVAALSAGLVHVIEKYGGRVVAFVNRMDLSPLVDKLFRESTNGFENLVLIGASKTHSYSRILRKSKGVYVNPSAGTYVWLQREASFREGFKRSRVLAVTTTNVKEGSEPGTIMPLAMDIVTHEKQGISHSTIVDFAISLCGYNNLSSTWMQSLPWPLHRADYLSKTLYRLSLSHRYSSLPSPEVLKYI